MCKDGSEMYELCGEKEIRETDDGRRWKFYAAERL